MKTILSSLLIIAGSILYAQDDTTNRNISIETQFDIFSKSNTAGNNLKIRYHFNEKSILRTNWGFSYSSVTDELLETDGDGVGTIETVQSSNMISLGYEHHISVDKISPYLGGSIGYGFGNNSIYGSRTDGTTFVNDFNYKSIQKTSALKVYLFTGFDLTLYKGLYFGSEIGFAYLNSKDHRGELTTEDASSTTDSSTSTPIPEKKSTSFSLINMGVIRVGWKF